ncbi:MAG: methylmalonyl Co-A mutase-associated GTPase MeaB [Bacteroidales bacterium]|jgi:LAO/AO transport system kinase|nr:methylmalonyl Co-A mutase-associated GTPase MeaB [Bacteroidales bacterium]
MLHQDNTFESALTERSGIIQPDSVNPAFLTSRIKKKQLTVDDYVNGILSGNRVILSRAITLVESSHPDHQATAQAVIERCLPHSGKSIRLGITGVPGAGKSTFIEALGVMLVKQGHKLAVLAVDPSSERSKGSILGDKTRMEELSGMDDAFIRPSPSAGSLGGVARKTRETIILCEAAGFDITIVETVGVGQSETAVHGMVDFFLLIQLANTGDELQGIKRGIMEMADAIAINKADGDNLPKAKVARTQFSNALHLFPPTESGWVPVVETCSAYTKDGVENIWNIVQDYINYTQSNAYFEHKRREQSRRIVSETIDEALLANFYHSPDIKRQLKSALDEVLNGQISPYIAANNLLKQYWA